MGRKRKVASDDECSLFDIEECGRRVPVNYAKYDGDGELSWQEMFSGYNKLCAITFSAGDKFLRDVVSMFKDVEIIFGWDSVISNDVNGLIGYQTAVLEGLGGGLNGKNELEPRIEDGSLRIYIAHGCKSHEKLYILSSNDGRIRVITGSGNMSKSAFEGGQRENITIYENDECAFAYFSNRFESLRNASTTRVDVQSYKKIDDIDQVPTLKRVIETNCEVIVETEQSDSEVIAFVRDVKAKADQLKKMGVDRCFSQKNGKTQILAHAVRKLVSVVAQERAKEAKPEDIPKLDIDLVNQTATLDGTPIDLNPNRAEIGNDAALFIRYFAGFDDFHPKGNETVEGAKALFWKMLVWMFASPMMAQFHNAALELNLSTVGYPMFLINYGDSSCGKTKAADIFLTAMVGSQVARQFKVPGRKVTLTYLDGLRQTLHGVPIVFDDVPKEKFGPHLNPSIKSDDFLDDAARRFSSPIVVSLNNKVQSLPQEICRRSVALKHAVALSPSEFLAHDTIMRRIQSDMGTALYREYLRRIIPVLSKMLESARDSRNEQAPDVLAVSSRILSTVIAEHCGCKIPRCMRVVKVSDYFGNQAYAKRSVDRLVSHWNSNPQSVKVSRPKNTLTIDFGEPYLANQFYDELLPSMQMGYPARGVVVLNLSETETVSGMKFDRTPDLIRNELARNPKAGRVLRRQNRIEVDFSNADIASTVANEAVTDMRPALRGTCVSFDASAFGDYVGVPIQEEHGIAMLVGMLLDKGTRGSR